MRKLCGRLNCCSTVVDFRGLRFISRLSEFHAATNISLAVLSLMPRYSGVPRSTCTCAAAMYCQCAAVVRCRGVHGMTRWWALARSADSCLAAVRQATLESPSGALHRAAATAVYRAPIAHTSVKAGRQGGRLRKQPDRLYNQCDRLYHHDVLIEGEGSQKQLE